MTATQTLKLFMNELSKQESREILDYSTIYYMGQKLLKTPDQEYDDDQGDYKVVLNDHIAYRYQIMDFLGKGSFGQALK